MAGKGDINKDKIQPQLFSEWKTIPFEKSLQKTIMPKKHKAKDYSDKGIYPVIDQGDKLVAGYIDEIESIYKGEVPIIIFGDHTRNIKYIDFDFAVGADGTKILKPVEQLDSMFFFYYIKSLSIPDFGYSRHYKVLKKLETPLPPLPEQKRIVAKLGTIFSNIDNLKTRLDKIPTLLKNFRQAVLTQAVTGKLTEEWRLSAGQAGVRKELGGWEDLKLINLINGTPKNGAYYPRHLYGNGTRIIRIDTFYDGKLKNWDLVQKVQITEVDKEIYELKNEDILINRVNSIQYLGKCMLVDSLPEHCIFESNMMRVRLNRSIAYPKYIRTFLTSPIGLKELRKKAKHAVNQASINQQDVKAVEIRLPPLEEQTEIVNRVESLFTKADAIEKAYNTLKAKTDTLPQAVLAKAFKGELVEQLDTDLPAGKEGEFYAYVLYCSNGTLYKGFTNNLKKRYNEHKQGVGAEHTKKYKPLYIYHYEEFNTQEEAVKREKFFKSGRGRELLKKMESQNQLRQAGGSAEELLADILRLK